MPLEKKVSSSAIRVVKTIYSSAKTNINNIKHQVQDKVKDKASEVVLGPEHKEVMGKVKSLAKGGALFGVGYPIFKEAFDKGIEKGDKKINGSVNNGVPVDTNRIDTIYNNNALGVLEGLVQVVQEEFEEQMAKEGKKVRDVRDLEKTLIEENNIRLTIEDGLQHIENPNANALNFVKSLHYTTSFLSKLTSYNNKSSVSTFEDFHNSPPMFSDPVSKLRLPDALDAYKLLAAASQTKVSNIGKKLFVDYGSDIIGSRIEKMYNYLNEEQGKEYANLFKSLVEDTKSKNDSDKKRASIIKDQKLRQKLKQIQKETGQFISENHSQGSSHVNVKTNENKKDLGL